MKQTETMIAWNRETDQVRVFRWPDTERLSRAYRLTTGACDTDLERASLLERLAHLFIAFNTLVVRDRVSPEAAHKAFLEIDEYRAAISPYQQGAE